MIILAASKVDMASMNIADQLLENHEFKETSVTFCGNFIYSKKLGNGETAELVFIEKEIIKTQDLVWPSNLRLLIFLSRHSSKSGTPTLSVHTPGNLCEAVLGGLPRRVSVSPASAMKEALKAMKEAQEKANLKYEVSYECTHHGPSLDLPTMLVELGSSPKQWQDLDAAEAVAGGALAAVASKRVYPTVLGIGGPHYNREFTEIALSSETAFGHIIPKYAITGLDHDVLRQCIVKTVEPVRKVILDWKGIKGAEKNRLLNILSETGLEIEKT